MFHLLSTDAFQEDIIAREWVEQGCRHKSKGDKQNAHRCFQKAAERGYARGHHGLLQLELEKPVVERSQETITTLVNTIKTMEQKGDVVATLVLGILHDRGEGVETDKQKALKGYARSSEQGYALAQIYLGRFIENTKNRDIVTDEIQPSSHFNFERLAFNWYQTAANNDFAQAQYELASCYEHGQGAEKSLAQAIHWYEKAASLGYHRAEYRLAQFYETQASSADAKSKAIMYYKRASDRGNAQAAAAFKTIRETRGLLSKRLTTRTQTNPVKWAANSVALHTAIISNNEKTITELLDYYRRYIDAHSDQIYSTFRLSLGNNALTFLQLRDFEALLCREYQDLKVAFQLDYRDVIITDAVRLKKPDSCRDLLRYFDDPRVHPLDRQRLKYKLADWLGLSNFSTLFSSNWYDGISLLAIKHPEGGELKKKWLGVVFASWHKVSPTPKGTWTTYALAESLLTFHHHSPSILNQVAWVDLFENILGWIITIKDKTGNLFCNEAKDALQLLLVVMDILVQRQQGMSTRIYEQYWLSTNDIRSNIALTKPKNDTEAAIKQELSPLAEVIDIYSSFLKVDLMLIDEIKKIYQVLSGGFELGRSLVNMVNAFTVLPTSLGAYSGAPAGGAGLIESGVRVWAGVMTLLSAHKPAPKIPVKNDLAMVAKLDGPIGLLVIRSLKSILIDVKRASTLSEAYLADKKEIAELLKVLYQNYSTKMATVLTMAVCSEIIYLSQTLMREFGWPMFAKPIDPASAKALSPKDWVKLYQDNGWISDAIAAEKLESHIAQPQGYSYLFNQYEKLPLASFEWFDWYKADGNLIDLDESYREFTTGRAENDKNLRANYKAVQAILKKDGLKSARKKFYSQNTDRLFSTCGLEIIYSLGLDDYMTADEFIKKAVCKRVAHKEEHDRRSSMSAKRTGKQAQRELTPSMQNSLDEEVGKEEVNITQVSRHLLHAPPANNQATVNTPVVAQESLYGGIQFNE